MTFARERTDIAVIGAGVVGLTIALDLAEAGRDVVLVDPGVPGMGASYGNAGTIAGYATSPERARAAGREGRAEVERRFSMEAMVGAYRGLYDRTLKVVSHE